MRHPYDPIFADTPYNGLEHWYYLDKQTGEKVVVDELRERVREEDNGTGNHELH